MLRWTLKGPAHSRSPQIHKAKSNATDLAADTGALEGKNSRTGALVSVHQTGRPRWTPRDYGALAMQGYARNPIVYRSIRMISEAAASATVYCLVGGERLTEHPVLDLLHHPNERQDGATWLESLYGHLLVSGNAYIEAVFGASSLKELHCLRPDRMKVVPGPNGWPDAYDYPAKHAGMLIDETRFLHAQDGVGVQLVSLSPWWMRHLSHVFAFPPLPSAPKTGIE